ncbi:unnamed protein product, partial [Polarella glacialis]
LAAFQQLCGINALMSYSNSLFRQAGIEPSKLTVASTVMAATNVGVSAVISRVVDHWGRRRLLLTGSLLQACSMAAITYMDTDAPGSFTGLVTVACFTTFVASFSAGLGAVTWLYLSEIYPMEIRGAALSACGVINWLSCFLVVFVARFLSLHHCCKLLAVLSSIGFLCVYLWVVETKGCSMDDSPLTPRSCLSARTSSTMLTTPREDPKE